MTKEDKELLLKDLSARLPYKIKDLADNIQRYVRVTEHNLSKIFDYFCKNVLKGKTNLSAHYMVEIFMGVIGDKMNYFQHPSNPNVLVCKGKNVNMDGNAFKSFFGYFDRNYTPQETMRLNGIADRLIDDTDRRNKGEFYTPTLFVDYAHKMISETLGEDWKEKYVVWDNCCGTKNLTRDYKFKELYCSTLFDSELKIGERYNKEGVSFQYDFLNDPLEKLPNGLLEAFEQNKKIVFFLNPPYAQNTGDGITKTTSTDVCYTKIKEYMNKDNMGKTTENIYTQFLYRIIMIKNKFNLTNLYLSFFSPTAFLSGPGFKPFRIKYLTNFNFINACQFNAGHFDNVASSWGISFSIWNCGTTIDRNNFKYNLIDNIDGEIKIIGLKDIYNADNNITCSEWSNYIKFKNKKEIIGCKSPLSFNGIKQWDYNSIGWFLNQSNNIDTNATYVGLFSCAYTQRGHSIVKENFEKCLSVFAARKLIEKTWINSKDEYLAPNESHPKFQEFVNNSIVYSLFNVSSNQASLRQIKYNDKLWDIKNEFFWMSKSEIESLANEFSNDTCYSDVHTSEDRFVYKKLQEITLTPEAQAVLDKASDIVRKTFKYRELFNEEHPEYQINNWDCGWYQIKAVAKQYAKSDYDEFVKLYKSLENKMRPMVYTLGFLR